jgi:hypothetical protein
MVAKKGAVVEEVSRTNQPFLEDIAVEGPLRLSVKDAIRRTKHSHEARDLIEDDNMWFKYSKGAAPCLFFNLVLLVTVFCLTIWQGTESLKGLREDAIPRDLGADLMDDDSEGGLEMWLRTMRWISSIFAIVAVAICAFASWNKLAPMLFKASFAVAALLFLGASAVSWATFAYQINDAENARFCERIGIVDADPIATQFCNSGQSTQEARRKAWAAVVFDVVLACLSLVCIVLIGLYCIASLDGRFKRQHHRQRYADQPNGWAHPRGWTHVGSQRRWILWFFLALTFLTAVLVLTFSILLAENRFIVGHSGVAQGANPTAGSEVATGNLKYQHMAFRPSGWKSANTSARFAATVIGIVAVLFSFLPFRTWVASHLAAVAIFCSSALLFVAMGLDFDEFAEADDFVCPSPYKCHRRQFAATIALETIVACTMFLYVMWEFVSRWAPFSKCPWCKRGYPLGTVPNHQKNECSERWVRCALTGRVMSAKTFVYHHVFQHSEEYAQCSACGQMIEEWRMQSHLAECPDQVVECEACGAQLRRKDMGSHATSCPERIISCDLCGMSFAYKHKADHAMRCQAKTIKGPNGARVPRSQYEEHLSSLSQ